MKVYENITGENLTQFVPKRFHHLLGSLKESNQIFDLIILSTDTKKVIKSSTLQKVFKRNQFNESSKLLFFGGSFTRESHEIIKEINGATFELSEFDWTDESIKQIRIELGSKVKINYKTKS